jgi:arylsulfatase A-like enzyme
LAKTPHVIIIMADQMRKDAIGEQYTPNIHALRQQSFAFERTYCASPLCVPARGAFFTGTYPNVNGSLINPGKTKDRVHGIVNPARPNLYELMEPDWDSWHVGKQHFLTSERLDKRESSPTRFITNEDHKELLKRDGKRGQGGPDFKGVTPEMAEGKFTRMKTYSSPATGCYEDGFDYTVDGFFTNECVKALKERDTSKPFLLNAMFLAPHPPFDVPEPWFSSVGEVELPDNVGVWSPNQSPLQLYNLTGAIGTKYTREDWCKVWPVYLGLVGLLDHGVGMILDELKRQGMYDDSLILFTSDHGEMLGSHCLWQKMCMYEESAHVPLYIKFPKDFPIRPFDSDELVSAVDVLPTLCEYLGIPAPQQLSGTSLMPLIRGKKLENRPIFIQFDGNQALGNFQRCVIEGEYKLIVDLFKDEIYLELYDVIHDPQETNNLAFEPQYESKVRGLLNTLDEHMRGTKDRIELPGQAYEKFIADRTAYKN